LPAFEDVAEELEDEFDIGFGIVDAVQERHLRLVHDIKAYPTVKAFRVSGSVLTYKSKYDYDIFRAWAIKSSFPSVIHCGVETCVEAIHAAGKLRPQVFFKSTENQLVANDQLELAAEQLLGVVDVAQTFDEELFQHYLELYGDYLETVINYDSSREGIKWTLTVFSHETMRFVIVDNLLWKETYGSRFKADQLVNWVKKETKPLVAELTLDNVGELVNEKLPLVLAYINSTRDGKKFKELMKPAAMSRPLLVF
jgi:hypothetical protein